MYKKIDVHNALQSQEMKQLILERIGDLEVSLGICIRTPRASLVRLRNALVRIENGI